MTVVSEIRHEGRAFLAVNTGMTARAFSQSKLPQTLTTPGIVFDPSGFVEKWQTEGTLCETSGRKETMLVYGRSFPGKTLLSAALGSDRKAAWETLYRTISLVTKAHLTGKIDDETLRAIATAGPEAIVCADDGRILAIPAELYTRSLFSHGTEVATANRLFWVHPDAASLNPSWSFAFLSGTLAYRIMSGREPFGVPETAHKSGDDGTIPEQIARSMNNGVYEPIELAVWNIRPAAAACINALVSTEIAASTDTLLAFGPDFSSLLDPTKEGSGATEAFIRKKKMAKRKRDVTVGQESFFRRNRRAFRIAGIVGALVLLFGGIFIHDFRSKPTTKGMIADEVVRGFYAAIASLDQEIPAAYALRGVTTDYSEMLSNLYVTAKMREAYEKDAGLISPSALFKTGTPGARTIYGITGLDIRPAGSTQTEARYEVSYYLWLPVDPINEEREMSAQPTQAAPPEASERFMSIYRYQDALTLELVKGSWLITGFEGTKRVLVTADINAVLSQAADAASSGIAPNEPWAPQDENPGNK